MAHSGDSFPPTPPFMGTPLHWLEPPDAARLVSPAATVTSSAGVSQRIPAPQLSVRGIGPRPVTLGGLTSGGPALPLFLGDACPTSAHPLRSLGPLHRPFDD